MKPSNPEDAALNDILARPPVSGEGKLPKEKKPPNAAITGADSGIPADNAAIIEPDAMEKAASRVIGKAIDDAKAIIGMEQDADFSTLMAETLGGMFAAIRAVSGRPWIRFAVAGGAIAISVIPPVLKHLAAKGTDQEDVEK